MATGSAPRRRLDSELVRRGLTESRQQALEAIGSGKVLVGGAPASKASRMVSPSEAVVLLGDRPRFVGRGGNKLEGALDRFEVLVTGRRALDVGASTGGFTDCLLQRGACAVVSLDVGRAQLHERLRADPRVSVYEQTDVRKATAEALGGQFDLIVADVSFISLRLLAASLVGRLATPGADLVVLVKPQFEAGRQEASRGHGVISDAAIWERVLGEVAEAFVAEGAVVRAAVPSSLRGADGNVEFFVHLAGPGASSVPASSDWVASVLAEVADRIEAKVGR